MDKKKFIYQKRLAQNQIKQFFNFWMNPASNRANETLQSNKKREQQSEKINLTNLNILIFGNRLR